MENKVMTVSTIKELKNKELRANLNTMVKAFEMGRRSGWAFAYAISEIVKKEQFKEDFKNYAKFADFVGMTKGSISQLTKAVDFIKEQELEITDEKGKVDLSRIYVSTSNAYLMSALGDDFKTFQDWLAEQGIDVFSLSVSKLKKAIDTWKESLLPVDTAEDTTEDVTEEIAEDATEEVAEDATEERERALKVVADLVKRYGFNWKDIKDAMK